MVEFAPDSSVAEIESQRPEKSIESQTPISVKSGGAKKGRKRKGEAKVTDDIQNKSGVGPVTEEEDKAPATPTTRGSSVDEKYAVNRKVFAR